MKARLVPEIDADDETERVYYEFRRFFRASGVDHSFQTLAAHSKMLPQIWDEMRANLGTEAFDAAADNVFKEGLKRAKTLAFPPIDLGMFGASCSYQIQAALKMYCALYPRLLVFISAVRLILEGEHIGGSSEPAKAIEAAAEPDNIFALETEHEKDVELSSEIKKILGIPNLDSLHLTLALWPDYLASAWERTRPICQSEAFKAACAQLLELSRDRARSLPHRVSMEVARIKQLGGKPSDVLGTARQIEERVCSLMLQAALLSGDKPGDGDGPRARAFGSGASSSDDRSWRAFQKRQRSIEIGSRFVSYIDEGNGEPVLLLHGIPAWGFLWGQTIEDLRKKYRVLVPDLLGYGYSDKHDCFDRSIGKQAEMIEEFLNKLKIRDAHLVANDIGGGIALRLVTLHSSKFQSLTLINSVCYDSWPKQKIMQMGLPDLKIKLSSNLMIKAMKQGLKEAFYTTPESEWMEGLVSPWRTETGKISLIRNTSALNTNQTTEITRLIPGIKLPTLIAWGEEDPFQLLKYGERLAGDIPGAEFHLIQKARHFVMVDRPAELHQKVSSFLTKCSTRRN